MLVSMADLMPGSAVAWMLVLAGLMLALVALTTPLGLEGLTPTPDLGASARTEHRKAHAEQQDQTARAF
jgi:hypothetical protein